ncbi:cytochrome o ubiquinol oxidase subunit IV [Novosphingobium olei]|uniref:Cytochrome bo(3) ubiquinol oxidase subunit 4 n=1 Tax=Novosphingobium olei TaxID=2728851 RepID=A0A7Y0BP92_9SPHN|nr:cytochrome o ubiquinol oxidase subunit IV [Novosphingobium olei]NML94009.1 cytochrome o ubiquinol oxidase subunit IV [Novosphingobium olei]
MSAAHDTHGADDGAAHGTMRDYAIGFALSVVLTAIPFWLVITQPLADKGLTGGIVVIFAAVQIVVHMIFFLHMNAKSEGGWNLLALLFTAVLVLIVLSGSLWVMHHLNTNMMPMSHSMADMP